MTQRHFEIIAETIKSLPVEIRQTVATAFADKLTETNSRFKRAMFLKACGV